MEYECMTLFFLKLGCTISQDKMFDGQNAPNFEKKGVIMGLKLI